jgi:hypothetical protein
MGFFNKVMGQLGDQFQMNTSPFRQPQMVGDSPMKSDNAFGPSQSFGRMPMMYDGQMGMGGRDPMNSIREDMPSMGNSPWGRQIQMGMQQPMNNGNGNGWGFGRARQEMSQVSPMRQFPPGLFGGNRMMQQPQMQSMQNRMQNTPFNRQGLNSSAMNMGGGLANRLRNRSNSQG